MKAFVNLNLEEQAAIVLITLLEDVANERRTMTSIEHHVNSLYNLLSANFDVPVQEVQTVTNAVAKSGIEMLPAYVLPEFGDVVESS